MSRGPEITQARVDELAGTPHCRWTDLFTPKDAPPADLLATIDEYLKPFTKWQSKTPCVNCGTNQDDGIMSVMMGGFTWGLGHGEGHCQICHWPARAYHVIKDKDGSTLCKFTRVMQYHPAEIRFKETAAA